VAAAVDELAGHETDLWPGFDALAIPLAIFDGTRTYLFRHPTPPHGFAALAGSSTPVQIYEGRHAGVTANSSVDIGGVATGTIVLIGEPERSALEWAAIAIHETFHVYQRSSHPRWIANEVDLFTYPVEDFELLALRRLEDRALARALSSESNQATTCWARRALAMRAERFATMPDAFDAYERGTELNEGLASYVQLRALGLRSVALPDTGSDTTDVRVRAYGTGAALALLLDRLRPTWRDELAAAETGSLDQLLGTSVDSAGASFMDCAFESAEMDAERQRASADVAALQQRRVQERLAFDRRPGWRVVVVAPPGKPLWPQGFDPLNVRRVDGGLLHTRFARFVNEAGAIEALDGPSADVEAVTEAAGSHPLFNGVQRVIVSSATEPEFRTTADSVALRAPGLTAEFAQAELTRAARELTIEIR
jgi:hypothetical protein